MSELFLVATVKILMFSFWDSFFPIVNRIYFPKQFKSATQKVFAVNVWEKHKQNVKITALACSAPKKGFILLYLRQAFVFIFHKFTLNIQYQENGILHMYIK